MTHQQAIAQKALHINGLDVQAANDTIAAIKADTSLARFQFRARNTWVSGGENRSTIRDFYGAGREDRSRAAGFEFTNGEPPVLLGNNEGAIRSSSSSTRWPDASRQLSSCMRWRVGSPSGSFRPSSKAISTCAACSVSTTPLRPATSRSELR